MFIYIYMYTCICLLSNAEGLTAAMQQNVIRVAMKPTTILAEVIILTFTGPDGQYHTTIIDATIWLRVSYPVSER